MAVDKIRELALRVLYDVNENKAYSNIALNKYIESADVKSLDARFITELVYGVIKWKKKLDFIIEQFSNIKIKKISPWILSILRIGLYQILYMDKVPVHSACSESVNLAKRYGHNASGKYVNGVLRNVARNINNITYPKKEKDLIAYLSVEYSHPEWMVEEWVLRYGDDFAQKLLESNNKIPCFSIRVNTLKTTKSDLIKILENEGVRVQEALYEEEALIIEKFSSIAKLQAFKNGLFQVQDESSMLVSRILDPKLGDVVVDMCAAPGGKSTHIAQLMQNKGVVISRDVHEHKIKLIDELAKRLEIDIIKSELYDACKLDNSLIGKADRVLVDAPCTGLGVIRRKPDIKWARNLNDIEDIVKIQKAILNNAAKYVKSGGFLVYSTCTIEPRENEMVVEEFIKENKEYEKVDITPLLPDKLKKPSAIDGKLQLYPNVDGVDGFFICKMRKS